MSFKSQFAQREEPEDHSASFCTVPGCGKKWSVRMEGVGQKCSFHAWGKVDEVFVPKKAGVPVPKTAPPDAWWNKESE